MLDYIVVYKWIILPFPPPAWYFLPWAYHLPSRSMRIHVLLGTLAIFTQCCCPLFFHLVTASARINIPNPTQPGWLSWDSQYYLILYFSTMVFLYQYPLVLNCHSCCCSALAFHYMTGNLCLKRELIEEHNWKGYNVIGETCLVDPYVGMPGIWRKKRREEAQMDLIFWRIVIAWFGYAVHIIEYGF